MQVTPINYNQPSFQANNSKLFAPIKNKYNKATDWLAENYFTKFSVSKFSEKFTKKTEKLAKKSKVFGNMTTHMSALGATIISGMYVIRTLKNDKLDKNKRKTLAINDGLTWGASTFLSYVLDEKLANKWNKVTTRYAANYLLKHPESRNEKLLGEWHPKDIYKMIEEGPQIALNKFNEMKAKLNPEELSKWMKEVNFKEKGFEQLKDYLKDNKYKNINEFNIDILKDERLDRRLNGMGVFKTLFIFGMVYRYIVPVLIMKPANKLGAYIHKKNEEKAKLAQNA